MIGKRLGMYEIVAKLGEGGMGEVYRARDTQLDRDVAIKVLPAAFAADVDRIMRFEREAKTLAALNHPNIAAIYGLDRTGGATALVMELVEGEDLSTLIAAGRLTPEAESPGFISIARQIALALEAAHDVGIIHRDLKPANVKIRDDGTVKVLDFGLAKALATERTETTGGTEKNAMAETLTSPVMTAMGMILGTAAYMAPEQAKGRVVDRRADVWAFGAVLYEMLTGRRAFAGDDVSEVLASVLARDPDWSLLPANQPLLNTIVRRCLQRDPKQRFGDMQSVRLVLDGSFSAVGTATILTDARSRPAQRRSAMLSWALAAAATITAGALAVAYLGRTDPARSVIRTSIPPPDGVAFDFDVTLGSATLSPDGRMVVFGGRARDGSIKLFVRALDSTEARPIAGTEGGSFPFWSPDSRSLGFYSAVRGRLERVDLAGGAPLAIVRAGFVRGATWADDNTIVYDSSEGGTRINAVPAGGGTARTITTTGNPRSPWALPGGTHILYYNRDSQQIRVIGIDGNGDALVTEATTAGIYADGHLLFMREGTLLAQPFDPARRALSGSPVAIARDVQTVVGEPRGVFSASETGLLLYQDGGADAAASLTWFSSEGKQLGVVGEVGAARGVSLSPDERSVALGITDIEGRLELYRIDLASGQRTRLTFGSGAGEISPFVIWSPDGRQVLYGVRRQARMIVGRVAAAGGPPEDLADVAEQTRKSVPRTTALTRSGDLLFAPQSQGGIWLLPLALGPATAARTPKLIVSDPDSALNVQLSPNERWITYQVSRGAGAVSGVFVEAYPGGGRRVQASDGGTLPLWSADGKTLFFADDNMLTAVPVTEADGTLHFGPPRVVMPVIVGRGYSYDIAKDGRILALVTSERRASRPLTLVQNWR